MRIAILVALVTFGGACATPNPASPKPTPPPNKNAPTTKGERVTVGLYIMSQCPYCVEAVKTLAKLHAALGQRILVNVAYVANETNGKFKSLHGESEIKGDIQQLCVRKHYPDPKTWLAFVSCQDEDIHAIPKNWGACADRLKLDRTRIAACVDGPAGKALLSLSIKSSSHVRGTPTFEINGKPYDGPRGKRPLLRHLCSQFKHSAPAACAALPPPPKVVLTFVTDKRCADCERYGLLVGLKERYFPKLQIKRLDYSTDEAKQILAKLKLNKLPVVLLSKNVQGSDAFEKVARFLVAKGDYFHLSIKAGFDPKNPPKFAPIAKPTGSFVFDRDEMLARIKAKLPKEKHGAADKAIAGIGVQVDFADDGTAKLTLTTPKLGPKRPPKTEKRSVKWELAGGAIVITDPKKPNRPTLRCTRETVKATKNKPASERLVCTQGEQAMVLKRK